MTALSLLTFDDSFKPSHFNMWEEDEAIFIEINLAAHRFWKGKSWNYREFPLETMQTLVNQICGLEVSLSTTGLEEYSTTSWRSLWTAYMDWQYFSAEGNGRTVHFVNAKEVINLETDWIT